jgi:hypothetical protein
MRSAEELLGDALSAEDPEAGAPGAQAAGAAAVADAVTLTLSAAAAAAATAGGDVWVAQLRARLLDVLSQLIVPLVRHAAASGRDAQARRPRHPRQTGAACAAQALRSGTAGPSASNISRYAAPGAGACSGFRCTPCSQLPRPPRNLHGAHSSAASEPCSCAAQALLAFALAEAGGALRQPRLAQAAAACVLRACEGAAADGLALPQGTLTALLHALAPPTCLDPEARGAARAARCTVCAVHACA